MGKLVVQSGTNPPERSRMKSRPPIQCHGFSETKPIHPQKRFNASQGIADEELGALVAEDCGEALTGYERHALSMIDQGLAEFHDLF